MASLKLNYYLICEGSDTLGPFTSEERAKKEAEGLSADDYEVVKVVSRSAEPEKIKWVKV